MLEYERRCWRCLELNQCEEQDAYKKQNCTNCHESMYNLNVNHEGCIGTKYIVGKPCACCWCVSVN
jgi:hypothetical protein